MEHKSLHTPTPHNAALWGQIANVVLMPGDPLRAKFIAETFLESIQLVSDVRNIYVYTGFYQGKRVSVMASGMGASSMGLYSYELFHFYDVDTIIRVGSAGGLAEALQMMELIACVSASTDTGYASHLKLPGVIAPTADCGLLLDAIAAAERRGLSIKAGPVFSGEAYYYDREDIQKWADFGMLAVEMESAALYLNAARAKKRALALCTISDMVLREGDTTSSQRVTGFRNMIQVALDVAAANARE